jgi:putative restriction endonuclease
VRYWVGVTDKDWFLQLQSLQPDEVNFWQPTATAPVRFPQPGTPFLFKLHYPENFVVGGGFFVRFSALPARIAWDTFDAKNGTPDYSTLRRRIEHYRGQRVVGDPVIGCNVLCEPFFFPRDQWIPTPHDWAPNIVKGKSYDTGARAGQDLWLDVRARLESRYTLAANEAQAERYGQEFLTRARLGQGSFRVLVTDAYNRRCAVTAERTLPVLEAAHIRPYGQEGPHQVANGILLRADLHKLFDDGYITVDERYRLRVSPGIKREFENGREYYRFDGEPLINLPAQDLEKPSREYLQWHQDVVFVR